jgi:hypothetical protein
MTVFSIISRVEIIIPMNQLSSQGRTLVRIQIHSDKVRIIDAVCINCNKRFKSMRAISMDLKMTATPHAVNFINYGNYSKKTGLGIESRRGLNSFQPNLLLR